MGYLVGNGTNLYTRAHSLVHSPIYKTITLAPDECAYYPLAAEFSLVGGVYFPSRGYISVTYGQSHAVNLGKLMRKAYLNIGASAQQVWYNSNLRIPDFIFYQGQWPATSGTDRYRCEAYMQIPAYHFTVPSQYSGATIAGASLSIVHYGTICANQKAGTEYVGNDSDKMDYYAAEAPNSLLDASSGWRNNWVQRIGLYQSLTNVNINTIHNNATDNITLQTADVKNDLRWQSGDWHSKTNRFEPIIDNSHASYIDDGIPRTFNPWTQSVTMPASVVNQLNTYKRGYVIISPNVGYDSSTSSTDTANDYPCYTHEDWGRWLCCSFGQFALTIRIAVG